MNILLTNDDGYDASGLLAACSAVRGLGKVHVVAPRNEQSACGHGITLGRPITVERRDCEGLGKVHIVNGTPADCVRLAVRELIESKIDLVVSGINAGANSGVDMYYSGTIAAAREGAILGIPAVAVSQALRVDVETDWDAAAAATATLVRELIESQLPGRGLWSINLPAPIPPGAVENAQRVPTARGPMPTAFTRMEDSDGERLEFFPDRGYWDREVESPSDFSVIRDGGIAITSIPLYGRF